MAKSCGKGRAQAGLEYLMTYGWALILISVVVAGLVFIVSSPAGDVVFSSSDPAKILVKAGSLSGTDAEIILQNATGGAIEVTDSTLTGGFSTADCTLNGLALPSGTSSVKISSGGEIDISCSFLTEDTGKINLEYLDYASLTRNVDITATGGGASLPSTGPRDYIAYYALNYGSGTTVYDSSGNGNDGTFVNSPSWESGSNCMEGSCLRFDSMGEYVEFTGLPVSTTGGDNTTASFWMNWDGTFNGYSWAMPFFWSTAYDVALHSSGHFGINTYNADIWGISSAGLDNRWVHVAAIFYNGSGDQSRLFIDGTEQTLTQRLSTPDSKNVSSTLRIGGKSTSFEQYPFEGRMDEIKVYDRALTPSEICDLCNSLGSCGC